MKRFITTFCITFFLFSASLSMYANTITNEQYGFTFSKLPAWDFLESSGERPIDAVRLYQYRDDSSKQAGDYIAARVFLLAFPAGSQRLVEYAHDAVFNLRNKQFTVKTRRQKRSEHGMPYFYYKLFQEAPGREARDMWIDVRFFQHSGFVFAFYSGAYTEHELREASSMFSTLKFDP